MNRRDEIIKKRVADHLLVKFRRNLNPKRGGGRRRSGSATGQFFNYVLDIFRNQQVIDFGLPKIESPRTNIFRKKREGQNGSVGEETSLSPGAGIMFTKLFAFQ